MYRDESEIRLRPFDGRDTPNVTSRRRLPRPWRNSGFVWDRWRAVCSYENNKDDESNLTTYGRFCNVNTLGRRRVSRVASGRDLLRRRLHFAVPSLGSARVRKYRANGPIYIITSSRRRAPYVFRDSTVSAQTNRIDERPGLPTPTSAVWSAFLRGAVDRSTRLRNVSPFANGKTNKPARIRYPRRARLIR